MSVTSPGLMKAAGSMASAVLVPMQWLISRDRIEFHLELALHEAGDGLFEGGNAVVGITAVFRLVDLGGHHAANVGGGHFVVLADAEIDQLPLGVFGQGLPLRPLDLLELVDLGALAVVRRRRCGRRRACWK